MRIRGAGSGGSTGVDATLLDTLEWMRYFRIAGGQINPTVGDLDGNVELISGAMRWADNANADLLLLPELAVCGYPPEDLVLRESFVADNRSAVEELARHSGFTVTVVGFVDRASGSPRGAVDAVDRHVANAAAILCEGEIRGIYHKVLLPNYGVFDEDRYFVPGNEPGAVWSIGGVVVGISICEDIWVPKGPPAEQTEAGAELLVNINASPYHVDKMRQRLGHLRNHALGGDVPVVYLNQFGGQDELVFDGSSVALDRKGEVVFRAPAFEDSRFLLDVEIADRPGEHAARLVRKESQDERAPLPEPATEPDLESEEEIYRALVTGLRDYVRKNGFERVIVAVSGGIDSALTATVATDALGPEAVWGLSMPSRFSSEGSVSDAKELAARLGIQLDILPIEGIHSALGAALQPVFEDTEVGVAEENLQARIRGGLLMAISNKFGALVVATGNKSEMAVGYATLYGDMVGGFAVLKDVLKTTVYRLAEWRNRQEEVIPEAILTKPPSAELRPDQLDTDTLPPYDLLDEILVRYVERDLSVDDIVADGFDRETVERVAEMVDRNEYKRRQAPPGVKITEKAFGKDRRLPITNHYGQR
ncbi:MAG: NAD+ synthase [Acidimicrobiia bacterium]